MKNVIAIPSASFDFAYEAMLAEGYVLANPETNLITGFDELGERIVLASAKAARDFLSSGNCLQLWLSSDCDLALSRTFSGELIAHLDGLSEFDISALLSCLQSNGLEVGISSAG